MAACPNLFHQRFDRLVVQPIDPFKRPPRHNWCVICRCDCGRLLSVEVSALLTTKGQRSCGCIRAEKLSAFAKRKRPKCITLASTYPEEYGVWRGIRQRCSNPNRNYSHCYIARGITIDPRWNEFKNFFADMRQRPTPAHQIERKDNDGPYSKDNCIWATPAQQARNRRQNINITINGETLCLLDWAARLGINFYTLRYRWKQGKWP